VTTSTLSKTESTSETPGDAASPFATAGPSRIPFDPASASHTSLSGEGEDNTGINQSTSIIETPALLFRYGDERSQVQRLEEHLESRDSSVTPYITVKRATRTWQLYQDLTPATRHTLPHSVHRAVLRQIVPRNDDLVPHPTTFDVQERFRKQWAGRIHAIVDDIMNTAQGLWIGDAEIALYKFAGMGDVEGVERLYAQFMRKNNKITPVQRNRLAAARLEALLGWYEGIMRLRSHSPRREERFYSSAARNDPEFNAKVDRGISERERAALPKADLVLGMVWSILRDFMQGRSTPEAESMNTVIMALDRTREVYHKKAFAPALDSMMERVFSIAYGIDLTYLRMEDAVADRVTTLKGLHKDAALVLLNWLLRRNEVWRGIALLELLDSGHWHNVVEDELVKIKPKRKKTLQKGKDRENDFGPTLTEATASFTEANQDVDMFGRAKSVASESIAMTASSSKLPSPLSLLSLPNYRRKTKPRTYADFYPSNIPLPSKIPYAKVAAKVDTGTNEFRKTPFTTAYRNVDGFTYRTAIAHAREMGDLDAVIHITRMFTTAAVHQQTYWIQRVFMEQRRLALSKKWREEQEVKYQQDVQARQERLAARRAEYIAQARAEGSKLSDSELERTARRVIRDRNPPSRPASETVWPEDLRPPRIVFSYTTLKLVKSMVKAIPHAHSELQEVNRVIAQAATRVYEEHVVLSGRKPTGSTLSDEEYEREMRQEGAEVLNKRAPMAAYFDVDPEGSVVPSQFRPLSYLARLNRTHAALIDLLDQSLLERHAAAERRSRVNRAREARFRAEQRLRKREDALRAKEEAEQATAKAAAMAKATVGEA